MQAQGVRELIVRGKVCDLGEPYDPGMPQRPAHPPFTSTLIKKHGDLAYPNRVPPVAFIDGLPGNQRGKVIGKR